MHDCYTCQHDIPAAACGMSVNSAMQVSLPQKCLGKLLFPGAVITSGTPSIVVRMGCGAGEPEQDHSGQNGFLADGDASLEAPSMNGQLTPLTIDPAVHANFHRCLLRFPVAAADTRSPLAIAR